MQTVNSYFDYPIQKPVAARAAPALRDPHRSERAKCLLGTKQKYYAKRRQIQLYR